MVKSQKRTAEGILILKNILSGLFPVLTVIAYANSLSPLTTLAWSSAIATVFFAIILTIKKEWKNNITNTKALKDIFFSILFIAIGFHSLYFISLEFTSAQNVSLLSLMEIAFSFLIIGWITKKEPISKKHIFGALLMLLSAGIILFNNTMTFNIGDLFILGATIIAPIGNIFAKRALHQVSILYLLFLRSLASIFVFFIASYIFEGAVSSDVLLQSIPYLLFSGLVFLGLMKIVTMFGFKKTSVTHTISFHSLKPVFAFIFAWLLLKEAPTMIQIVALIPSFLGLFLLAKAKQKQTQYGFKNNI
jgi:drug/metabolite transporter (DMT)-like permease